MMIDNNAIRYIDELETLRVSSELFLNNLSQEEVLSIISERALQISQAGYCEIFIRHPNDKDFISTLHYPFAAGISPQIRQKSEQLASESIQKQQAIIINHAPGQTETLQSWLILPFKVLGNIVGALSLGHIRPQAFSPYTIKLLSIFVDQASIAISNAQLFEDLTQAYSKLSNSRAEILQSNNTLQTLFNGISDGLYIVDRNLNIVMVNRAEIARLNLPETEILTQSFARLGWQECAPDFIDLIQQTFSAGHRAHWISPASNSAALVKNREMHLYPIITLQETVEQVIILAQDMTEQRRLQASLFQSANLAAIGQLATSVAHEINNPLTIALTNTQLLMMELGASHPDYELVDDIYTSNQRIRDIVANLVDLSNQDVYHFDRLSVIETLEDALSLIAHQARKSKANIERRYLHRPTITASRSHLKLAWMNLLLNACDAIAAAGAPGVITVQVQQAVNGQITITISDTGAGIAPENFDRIFRPFFTTRPVGKSVGLGLFTVHAIIERHRGSLAFQSTPGATSFTITLPENGPRRPES